MKRGLLILLLILLSSNVYAYSIYDYIVKIDQYYYAIVGLNGKGGDSLAASDIVLGLRRNLQNRVILETAVENEINPNYNKVLIGHPCDNSLIQFSCEDWPFEEGEALIKVSDSDLIVAGTTVFDTRRAAKVIANFREYPELKNYSAVVVLGEKNDLSNIQVVKLKNPSEFVCGDNNCEPGEKPHCFSDCQKITCFSLCNQLDYANAACRDLPSNPNVPSCKNDELDKGPGYCATGKACCCFDEIKSDIKEPEPVKEEPKQLDNINKFGKSPTLILAVIIFLFIITILIKRFKDA